MNWQIIAGIVFLIGGIGNITKDFFTFLFGMIIGVLFIFFGLRKKGLENKKSNPNFSGSKQAPAHIPSSDYYLAYHYEDEKFYPPFEVVSKLDKKRLRAGASVILKPEPKNEYDNRAVALYVSGCKIGYLLKGTLQDMANDYISRGWPIEATLSSLRLAGGEYQGYITLSFYHKVSEKSRK